jgi:rhamnogalacturonyl hydrolase YesR
MMPEKIQNSLNKLIAYCEKEGFKGYDPYDGLNSRLFQVIPLITKSRIARLAWIQLFKRSPLNLRPIVGIKKNFNPKGLGLFLSGYCDLYKMTNEAQYSDRIHFFTEKLISLISKNWSGACWGYNFDWQSKAFFQPKYTPTVVATSFIANSLLDAYDLTGEKELLSVARSSCDFILKDLNRTYNDKKDFSFSYSPMDKSVVYNASLMGSRLLARVYNYTREVDLADEAGRSVAFCCDHQKPDGSWGYGTLSFHQWIDNFHTGYNLECIAEYIKYTGNHDYDLNLKTGFDYYINTFFLDSGVPKYYSNSVYPIDIHAPAQLIITLSKLGEFDEHRRLATKVLNWTIDNMQSEDGYFYYQFNRHFSSKIPYMRWAQAWMFYALSEYLFQINQ